MAATPRRFAWAFAAAAALSVLAAAAALIARPQWFLTPAVASWAARRLLSGYAPSWTTFSASLESQTLFNKRLTLRAVDFCFYAPSLKATGCFSVVEAVVDVHLSLHGVRVARIDSLLARGKRVRVDIRKPGSSSGGRILRLPADPRQLLPETLRRTTLGTVDVGLPALEIIQAGATLQGKLTLTLAPDVKHPLRLRADFKRTAGGRARRWTAAADLDSRFLQWNGSGYVEGQASLSAPPATEARLSGRLVRASRGQGRLDFKASLRRGPLSFAASGQASLGGEEIKASAFLEAASSTGPVESLTLQPITLTALLQKGGRGVKNLKFEAPFEAQARAFEIKRLRSKAMRVRGNVRFDALAAPRAGQPDHFDATAAVTFAPVGDWLTVQGTLTAVLSGGLDALDRTSISARGADVFVKIGIFEDLVKRLAATPWAIPAPLDALKGPLTLEVHGRDRSMDNTLRLLYSFQSDLAGQRQKAKAKIDGEALVSDAFTPERSLQLTADAYLQEVALQLPRLSVSGAIPTVVQDPRIHPHQAAAAAAPSKAGGAPPLPTKLAVHVRTSQAAILYSNLTETPVPVVLDLTLSEPPALALGTISLQSFRASLFRRDAVIDHIRFTRSPGAKAMKLDGLILYKTPEAVIHIRLLGDTKKPQVELDSVPSLSRSDILALLIFGETPDALDPDQQTSISNTSSAVSEDAFGLASLYLFASTPIQYVGYDPVSRGYTVQFHLPGHSSLALGSNSTQAETLTLRKRLSAHWAVETQAGHSQLQGNIVTSILEWFERY